MISAAWNSREGAPFGRNRYVELEIKKRLSGIAPVATPMNGLRSSQLAVQIGQNVRPSHQSEGRIRPMRPLAYFS
jgi:hypothetical protein